jgi:predicted Zn-dependent protease
VSAHLLIDNTGQWVHVDHDRSLYFYNGATQQAWRDACRAAQVSWDQVMGGSLHFDSVAHDVSRLHCLDANYGNTGWAGRAIHPNFAPTGSDYGLCKHCGHTHLDMNNYYNLQLPLPSNKQQMACHEIGHPSGLAHSSDATDCMRTPYQQGYPTLSTAHRDQLRTRYDQAHG